MTISFRALPNRVNSKNSHILNLSLCLVIACHLFSTPTAEAAELRIASFPVVSPNILRKKLESISEFLISEGHASETIIDIPENYELFFNNAKLGLYDVVLAPSHFSITLIDKYNYHPAVISSTETYSAVIIVPQGSAITSVDQLKQLTIALPDPKALVSHVVLIELAKVGLVQNVNFSTSVTKGHDNTILSVMKSEYDAGIIASGLTMLLPKRLQNKITSIAEYGGLIDDFLLVNKDSSLFKSKSYVKQLFQKLIRQSKSDQGLTTFSLNPKTATTTIDDKLLQSARKYQYESLEK